MGYSGALTTAAGTAANAYGQRQAADAMSHAWKGQQRQQAGFDAQEAGQRQQLLAGLGGGAVGIDPNAAQQNTAAMQAAARNAASAVAAVDSRKRGGARGSATARARAGDNTHAILGRAGMDAHLAGLLQALTQGGQKVDMLGRTYGTNLGGIRGDARGAMSVMPQRIQAAGMQGGTARVLGTAANQAGQLGMLWAMSQPQGDQMQAMPSGQAQAQAPEGGYAASRIYHNADGSSGAYG